MELWLHIYGNTSNQTVIDRLKRGDDPQEVSDYFNAHPSTKLINYLTHQCPLAQNHRWDIMARLDL